MNEQPKHPGGGDFPIDRRLLQTLFAHVDELVITCRPDGTITFVSPATAGLLGFEAASAVGRNLLEFLHPDERDEVVDALGRWADRPGTPRGDVNRIRAADGSWVQLHSDTVAGPEAEPFGGFVVTLRTEEGSESVQRHRQRSLHSEERLVRLASIFLRRGVDDFDEGLEEALEVLAGMEWVTRVSIWVTEGDAVRPRAAWSAAVNGPRLPLPPRMSLGEMPLVRRLEAGEEVHIRSVDHLPDEWMRERERLARSGVRSALAVPMMEEDTFIGFVGAEVTLADIAFDVTQVTTMRSAAAILTTAFGRHATELELQRRACTDLLTGLGNQWAFLDTLAEEQAAMAEGHSPGCAVVLVDVDHFSMVNDALGFQAADRVLTTVSERLGNAAEGNVTLCRMHGDEFVLVVHGTRDPAEVTALLDRMLASLAMPMEVEGRPLLLTASAGVVLVDDPDLEGPELISRAGLVMQQARALGGDRIGIEDQALHLRVGRRLEWRNELRASLREDRFEPWFQGEWDLTTGALIGAEALARWHHPRQGLVEAVEFIRLAEESGMIAELGEKILRQACQAAARWPDSMLVRVNLSARQLLEVDVRSLVGTVLEESGLAPQRLCLELTETALLVDPAHAVAVLDALRSDGVGLAVDDFGTGYSSLWYLKRLPVTSVKIDRSFVSGLPANDDDRAIVASVVQLSHALGIEVTAEGVETTEQRDALVALECHRAQGFLVSRPESPAAFTERIDTLRR
jgi:diguanylate cyclase (GGDEF)-like protein/PAS domain S-box-containing protein